MQANKTGRAKNLSDLKRLRNQAEAAATDKTPAAPRPGKKKRKASKGVLASPEKPQAPGAVAPGASVPDQNLLSPEDVQLFRRAVRTVRRIRDTRRKILPPVLLEDEDILRKRRERASGRDARKPAQVSDHYTPAPSDHGDGQFLRAGHGPDLIKGLVRGKWLAGATLDLHGDTLDEARERLDRFLQSCLDHQVKCVRIVHGKGYGSKDGESVLKQTIRRWLTQYDAVLAYVECSEQDGGSGAVQVLLRTAG